MDLCYDTPSFQFANDSYLAYNVLSELHGEMMIPFRM